ncbi:YoqO family protein [Bacillus inaquosorum]|uniref:YoqO family protein n=1 Tax=Bacillus inaquosorum TaxID=483913 RepID=UPI002281E053|nr:YoqO family protein [Bacillus inaquosorum]MCY7951334.1 YoqO family protein [Bacillus inaquosorum]MEC0518812.1 YoqO family protein [Bacillus inaquosorum]MEC0605710.1 YoqO family protein [Bacillus inaquosorum]
MSKNKVFYLILLCLFISIVMKSFDVIRTIANVSCFVFVLLYVKEEIKTYTRKALAILSICFLFLVGFCTFIILKGQAVIKDHPFLTGWETIAIVLLIIVSINTCAFILRKVSNRLKRLKTDRL